MIGFTRFLIFDRFDVQRLVGDALDETRREEWRRAKRNRASGIRVGRFGVPRGTHVQSPEVEVDRHPESVPVAEGAGDSLDLLDLRDVLLCTSVGRVESNGVEDPTKVFLDFHLFHPVDGQRLEQRG